jgi:hypothetical protein
MRESQAMRRVSQTRTLIAIASYREAAAATAPCRHRWR